MTLFDMRDDGSMIELHKEIGKIEKTVYWSEPNLTFLRVRFISSPGEPMYDLSYAYGVLNKDTPNEEVVNVELPNWQINKYDKATRKYQSIRQVLLEWAKIDGVYLKDKGFFEALSINHG